MIQHIHRQGRGTAQTDPLPPPGLHAKGGRQKAVGLRGRALGGHAGDLGLGHVVQPVQSQHPCPVVPAQQVVVPLVPQQPLGGHHHEQVPRLPSLAQTILQGIKTQRPALLQGPVDPVQGLPHHRRVLSPLGRQGHRTAHLVPLVAGGELGQLLQHLLPLVRAHPRIHPHRIDDRLQRLLPQGPEGQIPAPPLPRQIAHRQAPLAHGGHVPIKALALGGQPHLRQHAQKPGGGQGMLFVGLFI